MAVDPEKLSKAAEAIRAAWVKMGELLDDVEALLDEAPTDGQLAQKIRRYFIAKWERQYPGEDYIAVAPGKEIGQLTRLVKASSRDPDDLKARVDRYFSSRDAYYRNAKHPLSLFIANVNKLGGAVDSDNFLAAAPVNCQHKPPCRSDQEHTQRVAREVRR